MRVDESAGDYRSGWPSCQFENVNIIQRIIWTVERVSQVRRRDYCFHR